MKSGKPQVVTETLDPNTERYRNDIFNRGREVADTPYTENPNRTTAGVDPLSREGVDAMRGAMDNLGRYGGWSANMAEQFNQLAGGLGGLGGQYGGLAGDMRNWAGGADQRAGQLDQFGQRFNDYANSGNVGARALGGDPNATQTLMNPYQNQVLDAVGADFDRQRAQAEMQAKQAAAQQGAFGGARHGVMEGERLGQLDAAQLGTMANLRQTGFNDAMGRAGAAANLGLGAGQMDLAGRGMAQGERGLGMNARGLGQGYDQMGLNARGMQGDMYNSGLGALNQAGQMAQGQAGLGGQLFNAGDYFRNVQQQGMNDQDNRFREQRDWNVRNFDILRGGLSGLPYGSTQTQPTQRNAAAGALGGAATGFGIGGPIGAGIGGLLGLFG